MPSLTAIVGDWAVAEGATAARSALGLRTQLLVSYLRDYANQKARRFRGRLSRLGRERTSPPN